MKIFTFGLARVPVGRTVSTLLRPPTGNTVPGLVHAECMTPMALGSPIWSPQRMQLHQMTLFAAWESEEAIDRFLADTPLGRIMGAGWHLRMLFLRRWGSVKEFAELPLDTGESDPSAPVAAFTLARMKLPEIPRFIHWGKPVESLVRDHPEATFSLAAIRHPRSVATFSVWTSQRAMQNMVFGRGDVEGSRRHIVAMGERDRRDFHFEFTTLRFKPLSEHGSWEGRSGFVRGL